MKTRLILVAVLSLVSACVLLFSCAPMKEMVKTCRVPDVRNMKIPDAQRVIEQEGFKLGGVYGDGPVIVAQDPKPWANADCGSIFQRSISVWLEHDEESYSRVTGKECRVPDVRKMRVSGSQTILEQEKFYLGKVYGDGELVLAQEPDPWDSAACYTKVNVFSEHYYQDRYSYLDWIEPTPTPTPRSTPTPKPKSTPNPLPKSIDITELSPRAKWASGRLWKDGHSVENQQTLPWMGAENDNRGFVRLTRSSMEDGRNLLALRMHPMWVDRGTIKGWYPWVRLPASRALFFRAQVGFLRGAKHTDGVTFMVWEHHVENGRKVGKLIASTTKRYTGHLDPITADLSHLAGKEVGIELRVDAGRSSGQDWAAWVNPQIVVTQ